MALSCQPLRAVGGGARGVPWLRILADVTGRTMEKTPYDQEAAAVGAASDRRHRLWSVPIFRCGQRVCAGGAVVPGAEPACRRPTSRSTRRIARFTRRSRIYTTA